jgi:hypothetical protein
MKRTAMALFLLLGMGAIASAQTSAAPQLADADSLNGALQFRAMPGAESNPPVPIPGIIEFVDSLADTKPPLATNEVTPADALPSAAARPAPVPANSSNTHHGHYDPKWELAFGLDWLRFRSSIFNASAGGTKTSVVYYRNDWLGIEGVLSTAFAPQIFVQEHVKLFTYGAGPKIVWRQNTWEPWMHAILGGAHEIPQMGTGSKNGLGVEMGGGADYHFNERFAGRLEGNYILTRFFGQTQNNFQLAASLVFHF